MKHPLGHRSGVKKGIINSGAFLFLLMLLSGFFACTESKESGAGKKELIRFVTWKPNQPEVWEEAIRRFHKKYPGLRVEREIGPHSSTEYHDLLTQKLKNRDTSVDVFFMDVIWPPEFAAAGWALPLDHYFSEEERKKFIEGPILANSYGGSIYGVPFWISAGLLYYRKDLLDKYGLKPPGTWEEMVGQIKTILAAERKEKPNLKGYSAQFKQYEGLVCNMLEFIMGGGGTIMDPETGKPGIAGQEAFESLRFVRDEIVGGVAPKGILTYQEPESLDLFIQGGAVFHRNWPYAWEVSNNKEKSRIAGKVGISVLPHFEGKKSYAALGGWQFGINRYSKKPDLAWKFIEFMTSPEIEKLLAGEAAQPPTRLSLYDDEEVLKKNPHFKDFKAVFLTAYPRPQSPFYPAISNILQRYFSKALAIKDSNIKSLAKEAEAEILELSKKFGER
ncbi:MAG: ABC transporter substrate-binding protein [Deltaproteobacteria bacterium]|nr:ABC transporter substrate-binding protein [Deltaproteobacteria bacterium]